MPIVFSLIGFLPLAFPLYILGSLSSMILIELWAILLLLLMPPANTLIMLLHFQYPHSIPHLIFFLSNTAFVFQPIFLQPHITGTILLMVPNSSLDGSLTPVTGVVFQLHCSP